MGYKHSDTIAVIRAGRKAKQRTRRHNRRAQLKDTYSQTSNSE